LKGLLRPFFHLFLLLATSLETGARSELRTYKYNGEIIMIDSEVMSCKESKPIYLPFSEGQWRLSLGLKALRLEDWMQIDEEFVPYLQRKAELRTERSSDTFASIPGSEAAQQEVLDLLLEHLTQHFPTYFQRSAEAIINRLTQEIWYPTDFVGAPLDLAGRLVQEDLCLMLPGEEGYVLGAASLSFPSYWRLDDKLGRSIAPIHEPVPEYSSKLQYPVNVYFDRLQPENPGYRMNWSITDTPELFLGSNHAHRVDPVGVTVATAGEKLWIRVERQTLRRLPRTQAILFTIRIYVYPLSLLKQHPTAAVGLNTMLDQIPSNMQIYKSLAPIRDVLKGYLAELAQSSSTEAAR
jgi:dimethylamine monooxygenase subunit A